MFLLIEILFVTQSAGSYNNTLYIDNSNVEIKGALSAIEDISINNRLFVNQDATLKNMYVASKLGIGTHNPLVSLQIDKTSSISLPRGTQAQRPADSEKGYMRYNTTTDKFEMCIMDPIGLLLEVQAAIKIKIQQYHKVVKILYLLQMILQEWKY